MIQAQSQDQAGRRISKGRLHLITSCTECHKRKQKCDQEQPCRHCARRFPPPACIYPGRSPTALKESNYNTGPCRKYPQLGLELRPKENPSTSLQSPSTLCLATDKERGNEKVLPDGLLEPLHVLTPGNAYQKLLSLMLSSLFPFTDIDSDLDRTGYQTLASASEEDFIHQAEKLKWEVWQYENGGIHKSCFGISSVEPLHYLPIKPTVLNGDLLQIFVKVLTKFVVSIDGNPSPNFYNDEWVPWSIKTPLLAQIAIYTASCYQSEAQKVPAGKSPIALHHKLKSISLLNETLRNPKSSTSDEAIASVVYLTTNEWYWGSRQNVQAHISGLREMVRLRGGIGALESVFLRKTILLCNYHIACSFDIEPSFKHSSAFPKTDSALERAPLNLSTPFLQSNRTFASFADEIGIGKETAMILDDIRFLLRVLINQIDRNLEDIACLDEQKLVTTSTWVRDRITALSSGNGEDQTLASDFIYQCCRKAALIYCKAIVENIPLLRACTLQDLNQLWVSMWRVPLSRWKKIPGIFIWILLSVNQAAQDLAHGRLVKSLLKSASFYVALENWSVIDGSLAALIKMQRWLRERSVVEEGIEDLDAHLMGEK